MKLEKLFQFCKIEANSLVNNIILLEVTHRPLELNVNNLRESSATVYIRINCYCMESRIKQKTTMYTNEETFTLLSGGIAQPGVI